MGGASLIWWQTHIRQKGDLCHLPEELDGGRGHLGQAAQPVFLKRLQQHTAQNEQVAPAAPPHLQS